MDAWESPEAFEAFRRANEAQFEALDRNCERLTADETPTGRFDVVSSHPQRDAP